MTSQLSRRRGGGTASPGGTDLAASSSSDSPTPGNGVGGSAFSFTSSSHKIAYDPRDLNTSDSEDGSGNKLPQLTLMEEVLLLGIKDKQGYLSFWNDNISYALRGAILIELALRKRIGVVREIGVRRKGIGQLSEKLLEVISTKPTGETILDETLRMMKAQQEPSAAGAGEKLSVGTWVDLLSGETWNVMRIGFQLKQVRERLAKGLVDKGVLRTEKRNFLLFDMATHPIADGRVKDLLLRRLVALLTATTSTVPDAALHPEGTATRHLRSVCLSSCAYAASVLDNVFVGVGYEEQEAAFVRAEDLLNEFSVWPWGGSSSSGMMNGEMAMRSRRRSASRIASGGGSDPARESVLGLVTECRKESTCPDGIDEDPSLELIASVLEVLGKLDSLL